MKYIIHAKEGLANLYHAKLRSVLALLGVLVGTASVVAMVMGGDIATNEALKQFKSLGTDLLALTLNSNIDENNREGGGKNSEISLADAFNLSTQDKSILRLAPYTQTFSPLFYNGDILNGITLGVTDSFAEVVKIKLISGRFVSTMDNYSFYCVIGHDIYESMKKMSFHDPLGQSLQIGKHIFKVIGVAAPWPENSFVYANIDNSVMVPIMASTAISKYASINNIILQLTPDADINGVEAHLTKALNETIVNKQVSFRSAKELITKMKNQSDILTIFLGLIGSISLLVGGIGVMNIMLVSVMERRREIGIRLAVGATPRDIALLFLVEAIMLSLVGGTLGVIIGIVIAYVITLISSWEFTFFFWPPLAGFSVSVAVGIFFGFYPAYLASKLDPIEALRME